jgi:uncharacterized protein (TIGR02001 family)
MKKSMWVAAAVSMLAAVPTLASAQGKSDWSLSGNMSLVSDYRFRSISQTYRLPAIQGGFDLGHNAGFYVGTWASNVSGNQYTGGNGMELDIYGGYKFDVAKGVTLDLGFIYYLYPGAKVSTTKDFNTTEVYGGVAIGNLSAKVNYAISDFFGLPDSSGSFYVDTNYNWPLSKTSNLVFHVGYQSVKNGDTFYNGVDPNYTDYKVGFTTEAAGLNWGVAYIGNNAKDGPYSVAHAVDGALKVVSKDTVVVSVGKTF